jgi:glycosyltransferase involved in cell wall biosynthesis
MAKTALICDLVSRAGGGLSYLHNIGSALDGSSEYEYVFLCHPAAREATAELARKVRVEYAPEQIARPLSGLLWRRRHLRELVEPVDPDVVLLMNECPTRLPYPTLLFLRNALNFVAHDPLVRARLSISKALRRRYLRGRTLADIGRADMLVTSSVAFKEQVRADPMVPSRPVAVAPFGTNRTIVANGARDHGRCSTLLCLQYNYYKDHESAIRALAILRRRLPTLRLVVTDDLAAHWLPEGRYAARLVKEVGQEAAVTCTGIIPHRDMAGIYASCDIFVFPSLVESFGHGLLEAMGNAMPCVVSDIPVFRELAGDAALYHKPGDPEDLARQISRLVADRVLREELGVRAKRRAAKFTWAAHVRALETAFAACAEAHRSAGGHG